MPAYTNKIIEIIKESRQFSRLDSSQENCLSNILEMAQGLTTSMCREDLPYYGFELNARIAATVAEQLSDEQMAGLGDPYDPFYRIYELATRDRLFSALHAGNVILSGLAGFDHADAPEYTDAYFTVGEYELEFNHVRPLNPQELEFIHREAPEVIHMLVSQEMAGA